MPARRHFAAGLSALSAGLGALPQLDVMGPAHLFTTASTPITSLSAKATELRVQIGVSNHEIGGGEADLGTILQPPNMVYFGMLAGFFETILNGFGASGMTTGAVVNARLKVCVS
jgi:hypothetical protein